MNGIAFILDTFGVKQSELAKELGVSRMTVSNWVNGKKTISKERAKEIVEKIPMFEGLKPEYFTKESLTPSEKLDIQIHYLHYKSEPVEIEDIYYDEQGNKHEYTRIIYTYEEDISHLTEERKRLEDSEKLIKDINLLLLSDRDLDFDVLSFNRGSNLNMLQTTVKILKKGDEQHQKALKILLHLLSFDTDAFGDPYFLINGKENKEFAKELVDLLLKYNIVKNEFFKKD